MPLLRHTQAYTETRVEALFIFIMPLLLHTQAYTETRVEALFIFTIHNALRYLLCTRA